MRSLSALFAHERCLKDVDLRCNLITDEGALVVANCIKFESLPRLEVLNLSENSAITNHGITACLKELADEVNSAYLRAFDFYDTGTTLALFDGDEWEYFCSATRVEAQACCKGMRREAAYLTSQFRWGTGGLMLIMTLSMSLLKKMMISS